MAVKTLLIICFTFFSISALCQKILRGEVTDGEKNKPVPFASVFLNNTSVGTKTNEEGRFELNIPDGKYELIVSSVGYETFNQTIVAKELNETINIKLKIKAPQLESVIVEAFEKDGWNKWGQFFLENFIGTSANALDCKIKNTEAIRFRNSKKNQELTAIALEPLIIAAWTKSPLEIMGERVTGCRISGSNWISLGPARAL